jgi:hypothetical protein
MCKPSQVLREILSFSYCRQPATPILQALSNCTRLTSISLTHPILEDSTLDAACLANLPGLTSLTLRVRQRNLPPASATDGMPRLAPLTSLSQLQQLEVKGVIPAASEVFLPASVTKLTIEGGWWCGQSESSWQAEKAALQAWLACGPLPSLKELHFAGVDGERLSRLDFSGLLGLTKLQIMPSANNIDAFFMPTSVSQLRDLEVLQLGIGGQPRDSWQGAVWQEPVWFMSTAEALNLFANCTSLRSLGYARIPLDVPFEVHLPQPSSLQLQASGDDLPEMLNTSCCPSLQHLVVQYGVDHSPTSSIVQRLAQLTALTCLQLNSGQGQYYEYCDQASWCGLEPLGHSLLMLRRLELVSCFGEHRDGERVPFW